MSMPPLRKNPPVVLVGLFFVVLFFFFFQAIHHRIIQVLNAAGFEELREPHMAVLRFPGPDGVRPSVLAERVGMSKQAMNQLLRSLEGFGYIARSDAPDEGRARIIRFTERGRTANAKLHELLREIA